MYASAFFIKPQMTNKQFLDKEYNRNRDEWKFADADEWANSDSMDAWDSADAEPSQGQTSQPYIIQIRNALSEAIANVDIGDSYLQRAASNFGQSANLTFTMGISGLSYIEFLAQTESQPFRVGKTVIISATAAQFNQAITITHRDASGKRLDEVIFPFIDPYQNQTDRIISDFEYVFDGFTRLRFNQISASATVNVWIFPASKFVGTQIVAGRGYKKNYSDPGLIKVMPAR